MKKFALALIVATLMTVGSQAYGQLDGGNDWNYAGPQPEPPSPESVFYSSLTAYQLTQNEANFWYSMQPYHPNAGTAATYFQISANYQYQSMIRLYAVWQGIEDAGTTVPDFVRPLAEEAATCSQYAGWYAMAGASSVDSTWWGHHVVQAAAEAYEKADLLAFETDYY